MKTVIVSRTRMHSGVCIGGLTRDEFTSVRLMPPDGERSWPEASPFHIGEVWDLDLAIPTTIDPPHVEDRLVSAERRVATQSGLDRWLGANVSPWSGDLHATFGGLLQLTRGGAAYIGRDRISRQSVGFWRPDHDLVLMDGEKVRYQSRLGEREVHVAYVGTDVPPAIIAAESLTRLSLSRWYHLAGVDGCWLQLSGCYGSHPATNAGTASRGER